MCCDRILHSLLYGDGGSKIRDRGPNIFPFASENGHLGCSGSKRESMSAENPDNLLKEIDNKKLTTKDKVMPGVEPGANCEINMFYGCRRIVKQV